MNTFADRLLQAINESGLSQKRIAERVGISRSMITQYLHGTSEAKSTNLYRLALVLNVSEAWLMGIEGAEKKRIEVMSPELNELIRVYKLLDVKSRTKLLALAYQLEDGQL